MQLGVCNYGKLHAGVRMAKEGKCFYRGVKGRLCKQKRHGFSLDESLLGKKRSLSSSYWALLSSQDVRVPTSGHLTLSEISVYCFILHFPNNNDAKYLLCVIIFFGEVPFSIFYPF